MHYRDYLEFHEKYYATPISYHVEYDELTLLEQNERVAGRVWITVKRPHESAKKIEVILVVQYQEGKIIRLWELTYPDWSKLPAFERTSEG